MDKDCITMLTVTGPLDQVKAFMRTAQVHNTVLSLGSFVPMPPDLLLPVPGYCDRRLDRERGDHAFPAFACSVKELSAQYERNLAVYGSRHWLEWRRKHWGTEWDVSWAELCLCDLELSDAGSPMAASISYWLTTVSAPPLPVCAAMSMQFPTLLVRGDYDRFFGPFYGHTSYRAGQLVEEEYRPYGLDVSEAQDDGLMFVAELGADENHRPGPTPSGGSKESAGPSWVFWEPLVETTHYRCTDDEG